MLNGQVNLVLLVVLPTADVRSRRPSLLPCVDDTIHSAANRKTRIFRDFCESFAEEISSVEIRPAKPPRHAYLPLTLLFSLPSIFLILFPKRIERVPDDLPYQLQLAVSRVGFTSLFQHQIQIRNHIKAGKDVVVTTPTASGKTLGFNIPVLETILLNPGLSSAIFLFPLNALISDQRKKLEALVSNIDVSFRPRIWNVFSEAGDDKQREADLNEGGVPDILLTNPDCLHYQLWKHTEVGWENWREMLARLRIVVLDEAHAYGGVFGSNMSNLICRLKLLMEVISPGSSLRLQFIVASATIGNPVGLAQRLIGRRNSEIALVSESGSRTYEHSFVTWKPQRDAKNKVSQLVKEFIHRDLAGLCFMNTVSGIDSQLQSLRHGDIHAGTRCRSYYASQNPEVKRNVLSGVNSGVVKWVFTTSALEAGVRCSI